MWNLFKSEVKYYRLYFYLSAAMTTALFTAMMLFERPSWDTVYSILHSVMIAPVMILYFIHAKEKRDQMMAVLPMKISTFAYVRILTPLALFVFGYTVILIPLLLITPGSFSLDIFLRSILGINQLFFVFTFVLMIGEISRLCTSKIFLVFMGLLTVMIFWFALYAKELPSYFRFLGLGFLADFFAMIFTVRMGLYAFLIVNVIIAVVSVLLFKNRKSYLS